MICVGTSGALLSHMLDKDSMMTQGFFAVGRQTFARACDLGIYPATAFLVLARGSGPDNITTSWSANAAADRMGIRWSKAKEAIGELEGLGIATRKKKTSTTPSYKLSKQGDLIWLPSALVDGIDGGASPVARVRQTHDAMTLRLLVELYGEQNLREDGGISRSVVFTRYDRVRMSDRAQYVIWGFGRQLMNVSHRTATATVHMRKESDLTDDERGAGKNVAVDFFSRFTTLESLGLVTEVPTLHEAENGEAIHPIHPASEIELEQRLGDACIDAARRSLSEGQWDLYDNKGWPQYVAPVPRHMAQVAMIGVYRLRFRPHTAMTSAWWASFSAFATSYIELYDRINGEDARKCA